jgi:hypothetical protein
MRLERRNKSPVSAFTCARLMRDGPSVAAPRQTDDAPAARECIRAGEC